MTTHDIGVLSNPSSTESDIVVSTNIWKESTMGYMFKVDRPVPADFTTNSMREVAWRRTHAPFTELMTPTVTKLLDQIGWDTEVSRILNDTGNLNEKQILWLMAQPAFATLNSAIHKVFSFALQEGYEVKVVNPGDKASVYRNTPASAV